MDTAPKPTPLCSRCGDYHQSHYPCNPTPVKTSLVDTSTDPTNTADQATVPTAE